MCKCKEGGCFVVLDVRLGGGGGRTHFGSWGGEDEVIVCFVMGR